MAGHGTGDRFTARTYGDSFADVYDDWYADVSDVDGTVATVTALADGGPVLELGAGTGRIAVPLAAAGAQVVALDVSAPMLGRLIGRTADGPGPAPVLADMAAPPVRPGSCAVVFVAFNTLFNVTDPDAQRTTVRAAAAALAPGGRFVVEAFVPPDADDAPLDDVSIRDLEPDRVVLVVARRDPDAQTITGQHVELTEAGGVRLRPWRVRYLTPDQLDGLAAEAGLELEARWADWSGTSFVADDPQHVSVYRRAVSPGAGAGPATPGSSASAR